MAPSIVTSSTVPSSSGAVIYSIDNVLVTCDSLKLELLKRPYVPGSTASVVFGNISTNTLTSPITLPLYKAVPLTGTSYV